MKYLSVNKSNLAVKALIAVFILATCAFAASMFNIFKNNSVDQRYRQAAADLRVSAHQISASASEAVRGRSYAFSELEEIRNRFNTNMNMLIEGSASVPSLARALPEQTQSLENKWKAADKEVSAIFAKQETLLWLNDIAGGFEADAVQIHSEFETVLASLVKSKATAKQIALVQRQQLLIERIESDLNRQLNSSEAAGISPRFIKSIDEFNLALNGLIKGDSKNDIAKLRGKQSQDSLNRIKQRFIVFSDEKARIVDATKAYVNARQSGENIVSSSSFLVSAVNELLDGIRALPSTRKVGADSAIAAASTMAICLLLLAFSLHRSAVNRLEDEKLANDKNQRALDQLLDEISELAEGDLSIEATVSEEFSGAIADSINFTIEQLRAIVSSINETTKKVSTQAKATQDKALALADESKNQATEISGASSAVKSMASNMTKMSEEAAESAMVAKSSVEIAKSGARVVKSTISGMDTIREQIQDTAKRIKRLGESSQEIGDIVSLITDIADQTNILALNASIQASMAGDAGRGFAVVADEVQRLAERSSSATRQIEALVRTIQSDTSEAIISMERTTSDVVAGANLTNDAGVALEEIERVSKSISELVTDISREAVVQAESAGQISQSMNQIKEMTSETSEGTLSAARQVGELSSMTSELQNSVAGFKLPDTIRGGKAKYVDIPTVTRATDQQVENTTVTQRTAMQKSSNV